jgi:hypothetical protein
VALREHEVLHVERHLQLAALLVHRLERAQVGDERVHVGVRHVLVLHERHERDQLVAVVVDAVADRAPDLVVRPAPDARLAIGRDVRSGQRRGANVMVTPPNMSENSLNRSGCVS